MSVFYLEKISSRHPVTVDLGLVFPPQMYAGVSVGLLTNGPDSLFAGGLHPPQCRLEIAVPERTEASMVGITANQRGNLAFVSFREVTRECSLQRNRSEQSESDDENNYAHDARYYDSLFHAAHRPEFSSGLIPNSAEW